MRERVLSVLDAKIQYAVRRMEEADRNRDFAAVADWRGRLDALIDVRAAILEAVGNA